MHYSGPQRCESGQKGRSEAFRSKHMDEKVGSKVGNEEEASKDEQEEVASLGNKGSRGGEERQLHLHHHGEKEGGALANSNQGRWAQRVRLRCGNSAVLALANFK